VYFNTGASGNAIQGADLNPEGDRPERNSNKNRVDVEVLYGMDI